jgi:hypothetical protein
MYHDGFQHSIQVFVQQKGACTMGMPLNQHKVEVPESFYFCRRIFKFNLYK